MGFETDAQRMALSANQVMAFRQVANQKASLKHQFENIPERSNQIILVDFMINSILKSHHTAL